MEYCVLASTDDKRLGHVWDGRVHTAAGCFTRARYSRFSWRLLSDAKFARNGGIKIDR